MGTERPPQEPGATEAGESAAPRVGQRGLKGVPRGIIVVGLLLYVGAIVSLLAAAVVPAATLAGVSRWVLLLNALVIMILATGLLRRRRWAWFATLAFTAVNAYYLLIGTVERGQDAVLGLSLLAALAAYLLWPNVRGVYLASRPRIRHE